MMWIHRHDATLAVHEQQLQFPAVLKFDKIAGVRRGGQRDGSVEAVHIRHLDLLAVHERPDIVRADLSLDEVVPGQERQPRRDEYLAPPRSRLAPVPEQRVCLVRGVR